MRPSHIKITIPSTAVTGDSFRAIVDVRNPDETTSGFFQGSVVFKAPSGLDMPAEHVVKEGEGGRFIIEGIRPEKKGIFRIKAFFRKGIISGKSNPVKVRDKKDEYNIYWGDIHGHSAISDGMGTPDEYYSFARDVAGLDICAITDHDVYPKPITDEEWKKTKAAARKFYNPGRFVTYLGYEWTAGEFFTKGPDSGHHCVYFLDDYDNAKHYLCSNPKTNTLDKLWAKYEGKNVMTIAHHTAVNSPGFWYRWNYRNDDMQRLVEIYSTWGSSEMTHKRKNTRPVRRCGGMVPKRSGKTVQEALAKGLRLGFIGGSDGHDGRPGDPNSHIGDAPLLATQSGIHEGRFYSGGLMAVFARELTREAVWDAMKNRRVYATTGARILVDFSINGRTMGEEPALTMKQDPVLKFRVAGTARIKKISIIRNNKDIYSVAPHTEDATLTFVDREKKDGVSLYYIRVSQEDGHIAWSSPIWVMRPEKKKKLARVRKAIKAKRKALKEKKISRHKKKYTKLIDKVRKKTSKRK